MDFAALKKEAKSKKTPSARLEELARVPNLGVQVAVASNPNTPGATLELLVAQGKLSVLKAVAKNPNAPLALLEGLAVHRQVTVRQTVAQWALLSERLALEMLNDPDLHTRFLLVEHSRRFAWNRRAFFERAAKDATTMVRSTVAQHCDVSAVLEGLTVDKANSVVAESLGNHALNLDVLLDRLETTFAMLNTVEYWLHASRIVQRRDLSAHWLERFAAHPNSTVRLFVARNKNTPRATILELARDHDWGVLTGTAALPDLPFEVYEGYARHPQKFVRLELVTNKHVPRTILETLVNDPDVGVAKRARERLET
jgi:hypothetical protein